MGQRSLAKDVTLTAIIKLQEHKTQVPLVIMTSAVYQYGIEAFVKDTTEYICQRLIIPDCQMSTFDFITLFERQ